MIRNGLYLVETFMLDGLDAQKRGIMVFHNGQMHGGGEYFYTVGSYSCSAGKWRGEAISQEHTPVIGTDPWARRIVSIGFTGTYTDKNAELDGAALVGKRNIRFKSIFRILKAD
jgi:hypothetical protein